MDGEIMPVKIFFCYAHEDEDLLNKLKTHLRPLQRNGLIDVWYDRDISAGTRWEEEINTHLNEADIILLLVSPDFINSDYSYGKEMQRALERDQRREAKVIPIILRPIYWQDTPFSKLQILPRDGTPIIDPKWNSLDHAFYNVTEGIKRVVEQQNRVNSTSLKTLGVMTPPPSPPNPRVSTLVKVILTIASGLIIITLLIGGAFFWENNHQPSTSTTPTATSTTHTPVQTASPQSPFLYQAVFSKDDQGWFQNAQSSQWSYNSKDKALESNGSFCCDATSISTIIAVAPYTMTRSDYTIRARIRVSGINTSHSYKESDPQQDPFFGLYVRGDQSNQAGYMIGINGLPIGQPNAGAYSTFLAYGSKIPSPGKVFHGKEGGGKDFVLDNNWHDYRVDVKGNTFMLIIDNKPYYTAPIQDSYFPDGPHVGIEDYDFYLQVQNFTVSAL
jgi:TIR domain